MTLQDVPLNELMTTTEAAELTGRDASVFRHAIRRGVLESVLMGNAHMLRRSDIEQYIEDGHWPEKEAQPEPELVPEPVG